jgi:hypothetical protein
MGRPDAVTDPETLARLVAKIAARSKREASGCLVWTGAKTPKGYGIVTDGPRFFYVHRVAYEAKGGPPGRLLVCHRCDNPSCVDGDHLFVGTAASNSADMAAKGRSMKGMPLRRLTIEEVREIRRSTETQAAVAFRLGVSLNTVNSVRNRQTWRNV